MWEGMEKGGAGGRKVSHTLLSLVARKNFVMVMKTPIFTFSTI